MTHRESFCNSPLPSYSSDEGLSSSIHRVENSCYPRTSMIDCITTPQQLNRQTATPPRRSPPMVVKSSNFNLTSKRPLLMMCHDKRTRKQVTFDLSKNRVSEIGYSSWTKDGHTTSSTMTKNELWYSESDYSRIHAETQEAIDLLRKGFPERFDTCYRGLEHTIAPSSRVLNVRRARKVVLGDAECEQEPAGEEGKQEVQVRGNAYNYNIMGSSNSAGVQEEQAVARSYANVTRHCRTKAYRVGLADARSAKAILSPYGSMDQSPRPPQRRWMVARAC